LEQAILALPAELVVTYDGRGGYHWSSHSRHLLRRPALRSPSAVLLSLDSSGLAGRGGLAQADAGQGRPVRICPATCPEPSGHFSAPTPAVMRVLRSRVRLGEGPCPLFRGNNGQSQHPLGAGPVVVDPDEQRPVLPPRDLHPRT